MDFDSPDVMKDFPGLYASELNKQCSNDSDYSDENDKVMKKEILIGKRKEKKDKERGYAALEGESSPDENIKSRSPSKSKKAKSFKFTTKAKDKRDKSREKDKEFEKKKDKDKKYEKKIDKEKAKIEKIKKIKQSEEQGDIGDILPVFGVSLTTAVERSPCHDGIDLPLPVRECIDYIERVGMNFEGVYKVSGTKSKVLQLRKMYNHRENIRLSDYDIPTITSLLKTFLRDLPEPLFTNDLLIRFEEAGAILTTTTREKHLKILLDNLPPYNKLLLSWLVTHFNNIVANEKLNKMSRQNLAGALNHTFHCSSRLLNVLLHHGSSLFVDVNVVRYIPPLESGAILPESPELIENELKKQESLLAQIHREMNIGCISKQREELLWEAQRIITQLKRKLKNFHKDKEIVQEKLPPETLIEAASVSEENKDLKISSLHIIEAAKSNSDKINISSLRDIDQEVESQVEYQPFKDIPDATNLSTEKSTEEERVSELDNLLALLQFKNDGLYQLRDSLIKRIQTERNEIIQLKEQSVVEAPCLSIIPNESLDEIVNILTKENQILKIKKVNLVRQIVEEQEMVIELKAQILSNV